MDQKTLTKTLFLPFEENFFQDRSVLIINGHDTCIDALPTSASIKIWQPFYPYARTIPPHQRLDTALTTTPEFDDCLILGSKNRIENQGFIAAGLQSIKQGGTLAICAANNAGGQRLTKTMKSLGLVPNHISKNHAKTAWTTKQNDTLDHELVQNWRTTSSIQTPDHQYVSQPGIYGWNKIDIGSKLLLDKIPDYLAGDLGDFGCGFGYLGIETLKKNPQITSLTALDADIRAVACAKENLEKNNPHNTPFETKWTDLTNTENIKIGSFKNIVMNPPFHVGKTSDVSIGQTFIKNAAKSLKRNGTLYMVANRQLPYEAILNESFKTVQCIADEKGYKCFKAER